MSDNKELKCCPFCGSMADIQSDFGNTYWVQCTDLNCGSTDGTEWCVPSKAAENWNRRATQPVALSDDDIIRIASAYYRPEITSDEPQKSVTGFIAAVHAILAAKEQA